MNLYSALNSSEYARCEIRSIVLYHLSFCIIHHQFVV